MYRWLSGKIYISFDHHAPAKPPVTSLKKNIKDLSLCWITAVPIHLNCSLTSMKEMNNKKTFKKLMDVRRTR